MSVDLNTLVSPLAVGAAIGALVSGVFLLINQWLVRRSEERRQRRELAFNLALAYWKRDTDLAQFRSEKGLGGSSIAPLDWYVFGMIRLSRLIDKDPDFGQFISEWRAAQDAMRSAMDKEVEKSAAKKAHG